MSVRIYSNPENESNLMMTSDVEMFHSSEYGHDDELDNKASESIQKASTSGIASADVFQTQAHLDHTKLKMMPYSRHRMVIFEPIPTTERKRPRKHECWICPTR